jgi:hypothetical protein
VTADPNVPAADDQPADSEVEEVRVRGARAVEVDGDHSSVTPAAAIEVAGGKLLLLAGQWLDEPTTYGLPEADPCDEDGPFGTVFPCQGFTLRRVPASGEVRSIRIEGEPIQLAPPFVGVELTRLRPSGFDSWFIDGRLEDLPALLEATVPQPSNERRTSSGLFYAGTKDEVRLGDRVRIKRWLGRDLAGVVSYVPGLSSYRRSLGTDQWAIRLDDGSELVTVYAPEQAQPKEKLVLVERAHG